MNEMILPPHPGRGLSEAFVSEVKRLIARPEGQWCRDIFVHPDLVLAIRRDSLNVYHRGASIFLAELTNGRIVPKTHVKYLVRQQQAYATLDTEDGATLSIDPTTTLWTSYEGPVTLADMLRAAASLAGPEKIGLHSLLKNSPHVVDVEIVLEGQAARSADPVPFASRSSAAPRSAGPISAGDIVSNDGSEERAEISEAIEAADLATLPLDSGRAALSDSTAPTSSQAARLDRLDVATLEEKDGAIRLVFHEAKHFANKELRGGPGRTPPVVVQIRRYEATIRQHQARFAEEYAAVCRSLVAVHTMRCSILGSAGKPSVPDLDPLVRRLADGETLKVDPLPRLVVFGFDEDQKNGAVWKKHLARLQEALGAARIYAVGNTRTKTTAAFR